MVGGRGTESSVLISRRPQSAACSKAWRIPRSTCSGTRMHCPRQTLHRAGHRSSMRMTSVEGVPAASAGVGEVDPGRDGGIEADKLGGPLDGAGDASLAPGVMGDAGTQCPPSSNIMSSSPAICPRFGANDAFLFICSLSKSKFTAGGAVAADF